MRNSGHPFCPTGKPFYEKNQVIFDGQDGDAVNLTFVKGFYYVRGQGAGGGGGNNNYWHNGVGGGSGAGFEGYLYFAEKIENVSVITGKGGTNSTAGGDTSIADIMVLGGGKRGLPAAGGEGGEFLFAADPSLAVISKAIIQSNGVNGVGAPSNAEGFSGGNSVLTGDGGGQNSSNATKPGAGGGGQWQWGGAGGLGMFGELKIIYLGRKLPDNII